MPELPSKAWIDKDADKLAARGMLPKGRSRSGGDRAMIEDILRAEAARRQQNDPSLDANARSEIPGTIEFFMKYGPSYLEGQQIPGRDQRNGGALPVPGRVEEQLWESTPGQMPDKGAMPPPPFEQDT